MSNADGKLPLGILKQSVMKLGSFMQDMYEACEDDDVSDDQKHTFMALAEMAGNMSAAITNAVSAEMSEEEFMREEINMDEIEPYPEANSDLLDEEI